MGQLPQFRGAFFAAPHPHDLFQFVSAD